MHINLNYHEIAQICSELNLLLEGAILNKIRKGFQTEFILEFFKDGIRYYLIIGLNPNLISLHLASKTQFYAFAADAFTLFLRKKIGRQRFCSIIAHPGERIVTLNFTRALSLKIYLFSKGANLVVEEEGKSLLSLKKEQEVLSAAPDNVQERLALEIPEDKLYAQLIGDRYFEVLKERLGSKLSELKDKKQQRQIKQLKRKIANLEMDLKKTEKADQYYLFGSVIYAYHSHAKEKGLKELETVDLEGNALRIPLNPQLSIKENAERFYKLSKKLKKGAPIIEKRLQDFKNQLLRLKEALRDESEDNLTDLIANQQDKKKEGQKNLLFQQGFLVYENVQGFRILVGRNADENEALYRLARGRDFWLHNRDYPGGYVIIRRENQDPDPETIQDAAQLALLYSSSRKQGEAYIMLSRVKYLSKSPGGPKGMVNVSRYKSLWVKEESERLDKLEKVR